MSRAGESAAKPTRVRVHYAVLISSAVFCALAYLGVAALSPRFEYDQPFGTRPILPVLALLGAAFTAHLLGLWSALRLPSNRRLIGIIVGAALLFRAILIPTTPIQEVDLYRYLWDGTVSTAGVSPFRYNPQHVIDAAAASGDVPLEDSGNLRTLVETRLQRPHIATILRRVHYGELPTVYPPVSQLVFAAASSITPDDASVSQHITIIKSVLVLFDVGTIVLVIALLRLAGRHIGWSIIYAWCPLVMKEIANSGHLDSIAVFLTTAAIYVLARALFSKRAGDATSVGHAMFSSAAAVSLLALAIGAKIYPIVFAPIFFVTIARRFGIGKAAVSAIVFVLVNSAALLPMAGRTEGLETFVRRWEMNDLLFMVTYENLRPDKVDAIRPIPWFSVAPETWRSAIVHPLALRLEVTPRRASFFVARCLTCGVWLLLAVGWAWRASTTRQASTWLEACFLTVAWFWLLSPTQNPWYWIWALPLVPFVRGRAWLAVSGLVLVYYLRFWLRYQFEAVPVLATEYAGVQFFDFVVVWIEYGPWFIWLATAAAWRKLTGSRGTRQ